MGTRQGDVSLLDHPTARKLLHSQIPARLAYVGLDATPRVVPLVFHWTGSDLVFATWPDAEKVAAIRARPQVAVTIDSNDFPYLVLSVRGTAHVDLVDGIVPEYALATERYLGPEAGAAWLEQTRLIMPRAARISVHPTWVGLLDFETRLPTGIERGIAALNQTARET